MPDHYIGFWNVENLFDVEGAPPDRRPDKVRRALKVGSASSEVTGWTQAILDHKLASSPRISRGHFYLGQREHFDFGATRAVVGDPLHCFRN